MDKVPKICPHCKKPITKVIRDVECWERLSIANDRTILYGEGRMEWGDDIRYSCGECTEEIQLES